MRPRKEDQSSFAANLYKQKDRHDRSTRNGIKNLRCKLYRDRLHVLSGAVTSISVKRTDKEHSVIGKHFLEKHDLKRMNLNTNSRNAEGSLSV